MVHCIIGCCSNRCTDSYHCRNPVSAKRRRFDEVITMVRGGVPLSQGLREVDGLLKNSPARFWSEKKADVWMWCWIPLQRHWNRMQNRLQSGWSRFWSQSWLYLWRWSSAVLWLELCFQSISLTQRSKMRNYEGGTYRWAILLLFYRKNVFWLQVEKQDEDQKSAGQTWSRPKLTQTLLNSRKGHFLHIRQRNIQVL